MHHICIVVADVDQTLAKLQDGFGFGRPHVFNAQFPTARLMDGTFGFDLRIGFTWMGNTLLELQQPTDDRSPHTTFLRERGEGLHHIAFLVRSINRELDTMASARGGQRPPLLVDATEGGRAPWCYIDGEYMNGAVVELIERTPTSEQFFEQVYRATGGRMPS